MDPLSRITAILTDSLGPMGPLFALGGVGLLLIAVTLPVMLRRPADRFGRIKAQRAAQGGVQGGAAKGQSLRPTTKGAADRLERFSSFLEPQKAEDMSASRLKMLRAGYRDKNAVRMFHFAQLCLGLGLLAVGVIYTLLTQGDGEVSTKAMILSTIGPGAAGYYLPSYWVKRRAQSRQDEIVSGFPDALDMMLVCVEAGQSLDQSILRMARESRAGYPRSPTSSTWWPTR